jgi:hypothetical protein
VVHADVHHDDVRAAPLRALDGLQAVLGLADDLHVLLRAEDRAQPGAHELLVVGDENPRGRHQGSLTLSA